MEREYCEGHNSQDEKSMRNEQTEFEWGIEYEKGNCSKVANSTYLDHTI